MDENNSIQLFEDRKIRTAWDEEKEEWYFSVVDDRRSDRSANGKKRQHLLGGFEKASERGGLK